MIEVSIRKTEKLTVGGDQQSIELEDGQEIRGYEQYKHLGVRLTSDDKMEIMVLCRSQNRTNTWLFNEGNAR